MKIIIFFNLLMLSCFSFGNDNSCEKDDLVLIDQSCPLSGDAMLVRVDSSEKIWIKPIGKNAELKINRAMNNMLKNQERNRRKGILVNIFGINNSTALLNMSKKENLENKAFDFLSTFLLGKTIQYSCFSVTESYSFSCEIDYENNDIGLMFIREGHSKYYKKEGIHPTKDKEYQEAENLAMNEQKGVWAPFYGMFVFDKKKTK